MKISGKTRLLGVLGQPLEHSQSPALHNYSAGLLSEDSAYIPLAYDSRDLGGLLKVLWDLGFLGLNVTVPFKEKIAALFPASDLLSVNTLYRGDSYWECASTDGSGFLLSLKKWGLFHAGQTLAVLGNGGAALSLVRAWKDSQPGSRILVFRRSKEKDSLFEHLGGSNVEFIDLSPAALAGELIGSGPTLLVQATSAPLHGHDLSEFVGALDNLEGAFVDMLYGNYCSALLVEARNRKIPAYDGLGMLVGQALQSQKLWWGRSAPFDDVLTYLSGVTK